MANLIQIKRSATTAVPPSLANGELAFSGNGNVLFIGGFANSSDVVAIGGERTPGILTANQALVANSTLGIDKLVSANLTLNSVSVQFINATSSNTALGNASNNELVTSWAIKNYVDLRIAGTGTASQLNDLSDVTLGSLANNDLLVYDAASGDFENHSISGTASEVEVTFSNQNITVGLPSDVTIATSLTIGSNVVKANNGITFTADGLFAAGANGISVTAAGINVDAQDGLLANSSGLFVDAGTGVTVNSTGVHIGQDVSTTADVTFNDITAQGNLVVNGTVTTIDATNLQVEDPLISLARNNNATDTVDIGFYGLYDDTGSQDKYTGLFRDATDGKYKLFTSLQTVPTTTVDTGGAGYAVATLVADLESTNVSITGGSITGITDLAVADGGTGVSTFTTNGILYGNGASAIQVTAAGTEGKVLQAGSGGTPVFADLDGGTF